MSSYEAADILDLAMQVERSGEAFYRGVAAKSTSPELKSLFTDLADQEVIHHETFSNLRREVQHRSLMSDDEWAWYLDNLSTVVQSDLFEGPEKALAAAEKATDRNDALRTAIGFEKDTLFFFYDVRDQVMATDQPVIDKVVAEERAHIRRLAGLLRSD